MVSKADVKERLLRLGVRAGTALAVHSSLSSMGTVDGGPDAVIHTLIETVGREGAIVMPTYSVSVPLPLSDEDRRRGLDWKVRILPYPHTGVRSGMGIIADRFRDRADVVRGTHRVLSIAAWGRDAEVLAQGYQHLLDRNGWVLLLGVDMDRCSALHLVESWVPLPAELTERLTPPEQPPERYPPTEWSVGCRIPVVNFVHVREASDALGLIRTTMIGATTARCFEAKVMVDLYAQLRREDPYRVIDFPDVEPTQ